MNSNDRRERNRGKICGADMGPRGVSMRLAAFGFAREHVNIPMTLNDPLNRLTE